jgi:hypothetical protein
MSEQDLSELEQRLAARALQPLPEELRARVLSSLACERRRETYLPLAALRFVAVAGWTLSMPSALERSDELPQHAGAGVWLAIDGADGDFGSLQISRLLLARARLPQVAAPLRSAPVLSTFPELP